ncbi:response regulator [Cohnella sp. JJ-181]|uniref:response regulator n=1 Tax=Cohnella rhizoplanae TaxID=2974897 RepID=UPI0022FFA455|nr:response regulator [Cohnella sp. JJ-181]CAI6060048.1 Regulator of RpoS [Cohnella sp. JJ-181]
MMDNDIHVLLVDDEAVDLEWLRRRVAGHELLSPERVRTAPSGFAALDLMKRQRIDIILSDIRMPIMLGTEFARRAKEINPQVSIVFISGHEDFHYAKEAIQLSAHGYLLKPVEDGELHATLTELCGRIEREKKQHDSLSETLSLVNQELLLRWFNEAAPGGEAETHIRSFLAPMLEGGTAVAIVEIDDIAWKTRHSTPEERRAWLGSASQFIRSFTQERNMGMVIATHDHHFVILAAVPASYFSALLEELIRAFSERFSSSVTIGTGMYTTAFGQLHDSYRQAQAALSIKWIVGKNRLIQDASQWRPKERIAPDLEEIVDRMLKAMLEYDLTAIDDCLLQLFDGDHPLSQKNEIYDLIIRITSKLHADLRQLNEHLYEILNWDSHQPFILFQFETVHDILSWLRRRFFELSELLYLKRQRQKRKLIEDIAAYVRDRLDQKITLNEVAAHFNFTPNYLGQLFKAETNSLFSDFLNEQRMKRVCELLEEPTKKVYEIAEQVGYKNIIYFNRQFKQYMGMSPGEYRKKHNI